MSSKYYQLIEKSNCLHVSISCGVHLNEVDSVMST